MGIQKLYKEGLFLFTHGSMRALEGVHSFNVITSTLQHLRNGWSKSKFVFICIKHNRTFKGCILIPLNKNAASKQMMPLSFFFSFIQISFSCWCVLPIYNFIWSTKSPCESVQASPKPHFVRRWAFLIQNYMGLCVLFNVLSRFHKLLMEGNYSMLIDGY